MTSSRPLHFAIVGAGFIFDRHLAAIESIGGKLIAVADIDPKKKEKLDTGVVFCRSFNDLREHRIFMEVDVVVICTPNWTHPALSRSALDGGKHVICEKPAAISVKTLDALDAWRKESTKTKDLKLFFVQQLRCSSILKELKKKIDSSEERHQVIVSLAMHRGEFYWDGWKGKESESGGLLFNIGVHYLDLLVWLFGKPKESTVIQLTDREAKIIFDFEKADCAFTLSLTAPKDGQSRVFEIDNERINLTRILESLHTEVYKNFLNGIGTTIDDVRPTIALCEELTREGTEGIL